MSTPLEQVRHEIANEVNLTMISLRLERAQHRLQAGFQKVLQMAQGLGPSKSANLAAWAALTPSLDEDMAAYDQALADYRAAFVALKASVDSKLDSL